MLTHYNRKIGIYGKVEFIVRRELIAGRRTFFHDGVETRSEVSAVRAFHRIGFNKRFIIEHADIAVFIHSLCIPGAKRLRLISVFCIQRQLDIAIADHLCGLGIILIEIELCAGERLICHAQGNGLCFRTGQRVCIHRFLNRPAFQQRFIGCFRRYKSICPPESACSN